MYKIQWHLIYHNNPRPLGCGCRCESETDDVVLMINISARQRKLLAKRKTWISTFNDRPATLPTITPPHFQRTLLIQSRVSNRIDFSLSRIALISLQIWYVYLNSAQLAAVKSHNTLTAIENKHHFDTEAKIWCVTIKWNKK